MKYRILHLIGSNCVGGPEKQILHHAVDMQNTAYQLDVGSFHDLAERPEIVVEAERRGLETVCLSGGVRADLVRQLAAVVQEKRYHMVCTHGFKANVVGYFSAKRTGVPHVPFLRGWTAETVKVKIYEMLERQVLARAPWVVCVSQKQAEQVARLRKGRPRPIVIRNAMLPPFSRERKALPLSREQLGVPEDAFVFGSLGRLSAEKGHRFLISAFAEISRSTDQSVYLIVVGDGREQEPLERQAEQLGIRSKVHFAGFQGNCAEWMRLFDCMVQPSLTEGTPNSVLEALCLQVPVVATAVGGVPDLIVHESNGLLVEAANSEQMAAAMDRVLRSPTLAAALVNGAASITQEYSPVRQRQRLIALYEQVLGAAAETAPAMAQTA